MQTRWDWYKLSRRGFLLAAAAVPALRGQPGAPSCTLASEQEEGPYYIDGAALRSDLTEGKPGMPLTLRVALVDAKRCTPLSGAAIDVWHCDAEGVYSGFTADSRRERGRGPGGGRNGMPPPPDEVESFRPRMPPPEGRGRRNIDPTRYLRGVQISSREGVAQFTTVYPGWYEGRAIHIHLKIHLGGERAADTYAGGHVSHTGQLFFPEDVTERVARMQPYAKHGSVHRTTQEEDGIFKSEHGAGSVVQIEKSAAGFVATVTLGVDPDLTPRNVGRGPGRPPFPGW